jgi:HEAT repeat protein
MKLLELVQKQPFIKARFRPAAELKQDAFLLYMFAAPSVQQELLGDWLRFVEAGGVAEFETACGAHSNVRFGPEAIVPLERALHSTNLYSRLFAVSHLGHVPKNQSKSVVPILVARLGDTNAFLRGQAALALRSLGREPEQAVPALLRSLDDPDPIVRVYCIKALEAFPEEAPLIAPALSNMFGDTNLYVLGAATQALKQLAPAAAPTGGVK